ncbi:MAG: efflux transporter outer membrane subunit [Burkholderiales bacterium]|nr:efflux transporter outer membrane subunit [Burkholderiales bacterium]MDQ3197053.1 efflux transporter outer membrane subunit [Pseudomonadota bacterium]
MKHSIALFFLTLLSACAIGPDYRRPDVDAPDAFRGDAEADAESLADLAWWQVYQDARLQNLLRIALEQNRDLQIAAARINEARAIVGINRYAQFPQISAGANVARSRTSAATGIPVFVGRDRTNYAASIDATYEADLWGRLSSLTEAARADLLATGFARETIRISLIADVATAYFDLLSLDQQYDITQRTVATRQKFTELTRARFERGVASGLDVSRAEANLAAAQATLPELKRQIVQTENLLSVLLAQNPDFVVRERIDLQSLPPPPAVPPGLPSSLLERRPDLVAAEYNMVAANARLKSAKAALFPTIALTGSFGGQSLAFSDLFTGPARAWSFGLGLLQPILDANRNRYQVEAASARDEQVVQQYRQTVEQAFREVADALAARRNFADFVAAQEAQVNALRTARQRAQRRYEVGFSSYFEVIDADQDLFTAELQLVQGYRNTLVSLVQLYRALGGGWDAVLQQDSARGGSAQQE